MKSYLKNLKQLRGDRIRQVSNDPNATMVRAST